MIKTINSQCKSAKNAIPLKSTWLLLNMKIKNMHLLLIQIRVFGEKWNIKNGCKSFMEMLIKILIIILKINLLMISINIIRIIFKQMKLLKVMKTHLI